MYSPEQQYQELNKKMLDAMEKYFRTGAKSDKREYQEAVENYQNFALIILRNSWKKMLTY